MSDDIRCMTDFSELDYKVNEDLRCPKCNGIHLIKLMDSDNSIKYKCMDCKCIIR